MEVQQVLEAYEEEVKKQAVKSSKVLCLFAMIFFPLFGVIDAKVHPEVLTELVSIRGALFLFYLGSFLYIRKIHSFDQPMMTFGFLILVGGVGITLMNYIIGFEQSPKYIGIILVMLAASVLTPKDGFHVFQLNAMVLFTYTFGAFVALGSEFITNSVLLFNLAVMLLIAALGSIGAHYVHASRERLFFNLYESNKIKDILKNQMKSRKESLEELVAENAEQRAAIEKALSLRDEFISIASHELKTPIAVLKTQAELIKMGCEDESMRLSDEDKLSLLKNMNTNLDNISRLIDDMRDVTRIQSGNLELHKVKANLNDLMTRIISNFRMSDGVQIEFLEEDKDVVGTWDAFRLEQVFVNLLSNAIKYGAKSKSPKVTLFKPSAERVMVEIRDFGEGLSSEQIKLLYKKYTRIENVKGRGLGLGLYITKKIIEAHGGNISVESEVGKGSTFKVELPLES